MDASFRGHLSKAHMAPDKYRRVAAPEANLEQEKGGGTEKRVQEINDAHLLAVESVPGPQVQVRAQGLAEEALAEKTVKVKWVNGRKQVTGNPANLKESGEYPVGYATVLLSVWQRCPSRAPKVDLSLSEILGFLPFPSGGIYQATLPTESFPIADAFAAPAGFTELLTRMNNS